MLALPRQEIQEMKLKWFQIRLLHRILATNIVLKEMGHNTVFCAIFVTLKGIVYNIVCADVSIIMKSFWNGLERFICQNSENVHNFKSNESNKQKWYQH